MKDLTVVIPAYNEELNVARCVESVVAFAEKVIVVDNNSSDMTRIEILMLTKKYPNVEYAFTAEKQSCYHAVNAGIKLAETKWLLLLDCDCTISSLMLVKLWNVRNESAVVLPGMSYVAQGLPSNFVQSANYDFMNNVGKRNACVMTTKKLLVDNGMFEEDRTAGSDRELFTRIPCLLYPDAIIQHYVTPTGYLKRFFRYGTDNYKLRPSILMYALCLLRVLLSPLLLVGETLPIALTNKWWKKDAISRVLSPVTRILKNIFIDLGYVASPFLSNDVITKFTFNNK